MKCTVVSAILLTLCLSGTALAQGSGSVEPIGQPSFPQTPAGTGGFTVTRSAKGIIVEINTADNRLVIEDKKGRRLTVTLNGSTRYKAAKKTEFAGRTDLTIAEFRSGQPVRITYLPDSETVVEVHLLRKL